MAPCTISWLEMAEIVEPCESIANHSFAVVKDKDKNEVDSPMSL
jgi:hypothetical protein